jgi:hypothetical protein
MLRLDPAYPVLWRTPSTVQFGLDPAAIIEDPEPWQLRLIDELGRGIPDSAVDPVAMVFGAPEGAGARFVQEVARVVRGDDRPSAHRARLAVPAVLAETTRAALVGALTSAGVTLDTGETDASTPVIVVAHHVVDPRRVAPFMAGDIPHLPIVLGADRIEVGPYVTPGRTACLSCVGAHRLDRDPHWQALASQLTTHPPAVIADSRIVEAGLVAARLLSDAARHPRRQAHRSIELLPREVQPRVRVHRPHARCGCRSLKGIGTAGDPARLAPTSSSASAVPA